MDRKRAWALVIAFFFAWFVGLVLFFIGLVTVFDDTTPTPTLNVSGFIVLVVGGAFLLAAVALFIVWFATQNRDMNRITNGHFNTLLWTLLLLVPIANLLSIYMFAEHIRLAQSRIGVTGMPSVATFLIVILAAFIGLHFIGLVVAQLQMDKLGDRRRGDAPEPNPAPFMAAPATPAPASLLAHDPRGFIRVEHPPFYSGQGRLTAPMEPPAWPPGWPAPGLDPGAVHVRPARAEVLAMPAAGILMMFLSIASLPLAVAGPAGVISGAIALAARRRLIRLERMTPGHRGVRATIWSDKLAWIGISLGLTMTAVIITIAIVASLTG